MLTGMVNMETASRGYLLSGDSRFLAPWDEGLKEFEASWQEAVRLTEDNPAQQRRLDGIRLRHREFVQAVQPLQALRRQVQEGSATVEDLVREFSLGREKAAMDGLRALQADLVREEEQLMAERLTRTESLAAMTLAFELGGGRWWPSCWPPCWAPGSRAPSPAPSAGPSRWHARWHAGI